MANIRLSDVVQSTPVTGVERVLGTQSSGTKTFEYYDMSEVKDYMISGVSDFVTVGNSSITGTYAGVDGDYLNVGAAVAAAGTTGPLKIKIVGNVCPIKYD